jgi:hypothetical protein
MLNVYQYHLEPAKLLHGSNGVKAEELMAAVEQELEDISDSFMYGIEVNRTGLKITVEMDMEGEEDNREGFIQYNVAANELRCEYNGQDSSYQVGDSDYDLVGGRICLDLRELMIEDE